MRQHAVFGELNDIITCARDVKKMIIVHEQDFVFFIAIMLHWILDRTNGQQTGSCSTEEIEYPCLYVVVEEVTWDAAQQYCAGSQGRLYVSATSEDQRKVEGFLHGLTAEGGSVPEALWLGGHAAVKHIWSWWPGESSLGPQGCFKDLPQDQDLPYFVSIPELQPDFCIASCYLAGFKYYGLQNGNQCHCGNTFGRHGRSDEPCDIICSGNAEFLCGGRDSNSIGLVAGTRVGEWASSQIPGDDSFCGTLAPDRNYLYSSESCDKEYDYICKLPDGSYCPRNISVGEGYYDKGDVDYGQCFLVSLVKRNWRQAQIQCEQHNGALVKITSSYVMQELKQMIARKLAARELTDDAQAHWIALTKLAWEWSQSDSEWLNGNHNWDQAAPSVGTGVCLAMFTKDAYSWRDVPCNQSLPFICETAQPMTSSSTSVSITSATATSEGTPSSVSSTRSFSSSSGSTPSDVSPNTGVPPSSTTRTTASPVIVPPSSSAQAATGQEQSRPDFVLIVLLVLLLLILLLVGLIIIGVVYRKRRKKKNRIDPICSPDDDKDDGEDILNKTAAAALSRSNIDIDKGTMTTYHGRHSKSYNVS